MYQFLGVKAGGMSFIVKHGCRGTANTAMKLSSAQCMKQTQQRLTLDHSHRPQVIHRHQRFGAIIVYDRSKAGGYSSERFIPTDPFELSDALIACAFQWIEQSVRSISSILIRAYLRAKTSACEGMLPCTFNANNPFVLNFRYPGASVWAIQWATAFNSLYLQFVIAPGIITSRI